MFRSRFFALSAVVLWAASAMYAQVEGKVTGTVLDSSGAAIPDASVSLQIPGSGAAAYATKTNASGGFTLLSVPSNTYDLAIESKGFLKKVLNGVKVDTGRSTDVPAISLEVGGVTETVEVTESAATIQTSNAEVSTTIGKTQIQNLPVANRSPLAFVQTQVGVNNTRGGTTINGQRISYTNVTLDGVNVQDNFIRTNDLDFLPNLLLLDQVAEVTVTSSNASAANFGGSSQVQFVTPSGGNQYHGEVYWSNRNNYFKANSFFNNQSGIKNPFLNQNQMGGAIGGHIIKNKLFFYSNYEAYRQHAQATRNNTILTADARSGIFTYKDSGGGIHKVNILQAAGVTADPTVAALVAKLPTPDQINNYNVGDSTAAFQRNTAGYLFTRRNNRVRDNVTAKGDYVYSSKHSLTATYTQNRDILDRPDQDTTFSITPLQANNETTKLLSVAWRWNPTPTITNEARFGFNWAPSIFLDTQTIPKYFLGGANFSFTNPDGAVLRTQGRNTDTYNYADNASWVHGNHTLQFGFQAQAVRIEQYNDAGITPTYNIGFGTNLGSQFQLTGTQLPGVSSSDLTAANNLLATLGGFYNGYSQTFNVNTRNSGFVNGANNTRHDIQNNYALYAQDNWKLKRNLTMTLGIRWDYYPAVDERDALALLPVLENNNPIQTILDPNAKLDFAGGAVGRSWYNPGWRHFAPNLGIAWDPTGDSKWVIRAGYSLSYVNDNIVRALDNAVGTNSGLSSAVSASGIDGRLSTGVVNVATPNYKVPLTIADNYAINSQNATAMPDPGLVTPYVQQFNIGVQRSLWGTVLDVHYVGNHSTKSIRGFDYNQVLINQLMPDFLRAQSNGFLAQASTGTFNPAYNANIAGSQPLPFLGTLANSNLANSTVRSNIQTGQVGELANYYMINGLNGPVSFYTNPKELGGNVLTNYSNSSYNALQVDVMHRFAHGVQFQVNYAFSKVLSDASGDQQTDFEPFLDNNNTKIERRRVSGYDTTHVLKGNFDYQLPFGVNKRFKAGNSIVNRIIGGWDVAGIYTQESGGPISILSSRGTLNRQGRSTGNTVNTFDNLGQLQSLFQVYKNGNGIYYFPQGNLNPTDNRAVAPDGSAPFAGQVFYQPAAGSLGTLQRNLLSAPGVWTMDAKVSKFTSITETKNIELRMDAINVFNHDTWAVGDQTVTSTTFGKITSNFYGNRLLQFALYLHF